ncbi:MAG: glycosyltransferase family 4 protein [Patescibacteria group bacterium]|jgi:glycosyltransferase involved in cell wall biosynthesis
MKNLLVLNYEFPPLGGGAGPVSYEVARALSEMGNYNIDVVTMGFSGLNTYEEINPLFRIHRVRCLRSKKEICYPWEQATYLFSAYRKCKLLMANKKYDICHTHFLIPTGILALLLKRRFVLPYIITTHGSDVHGHIPRLNKYHAIMKPLSRSIVSNALAITSPSQKLLLEIEQHFDNIKSKTTIISHGIIPDMFIPASHKGNHILVVNRLVPIKRTDEIIRAISECHLGNWDVNIVGDGPEIGNLKKLSRQLKVAHKIKFWGWIDHGDNKLKDIYSKAKVFVSASNNDSFNISILEAIQAGCIIIASNKNGLIDALDKSGAKIITYQSGDMKGLIAKLTHAINHTEHYDEAVLRNREIINADYSWKKIAASYHSIINHVLDHV